MYSSWINGSHTCPNYAPKYTRWDLVGLITIPLNDAVVRRHCHRSLYGDSNQTITYASASHHPISLLDDKADKKRKNYIVIAED